MMGPRDPHGAVYPRPRGEAPHLRSGPFLGSGLSPPTRGSLATPSLAPLITRSIPAHAGKPRPRTARSARKGVYPRPRGEAVANMLAIAVRLGLSPPTRGSLIETVPKILPRRSIPAHAGKPWPTDSEAVSETVYPRPRGEAPFWPSVGLSWPGLSPPTRGSHRGPQLLPRPGGSIPAHAGKPTWKVRRERARGVYPRPRGEANVHSVPVECDQGLSPPTRGSPRAGRQDRPGRGSIPAHAGKPWCVT